MLVCKFVPGLNTAAPALSATAGIGLPQFLLFDWLGALLWASAFAGLGLVFSKQFDRIADDVAQFGSWTLLADRCRNRRLHRIQTVSSVAAS